MVVIWAQVCEVVATAMMADRRSAWGFPPAPAVGNKAAQRSFRDSAVEAVVAGVLRGSGGLSSHNWVCNPTCNWGNQYEASEEDKQ